MTRRLRTTGNYTTFVRSIDVKCVAVLAVKRLVLLANQGESSDSVQEEMSGDSNALERDSRVVANVEHGARELIRDCCTLFCLSAVQ